LGIDLFMSIPYSPALVAYGAFVPWTKLAFVRWLMLPERGASKIIFILLAATVVLSLAGSFYSPYFSHRAIVWVAPLIVSAFAFHRHQRRHHAGKFTEATPLHTGGSKSSGESGGTSEKDGMASAPPVRCDQVSGTATM
jgi:hypothetical protein